jgi:ATP-dependent helicase HrpB
VLHADDPLVACSALAVAQLDGQGQDARIQLAVPIDMGQLRQLAEQPGGQGYAAVEARWDGESQRVRCERSLRLGALLLERRSWSEAEPALIRRALLDGLRQLGLEALPWDQASRQLQQRLSLAYQHLGEPWPNCSPEQLLMQLDAWLGPHLSGLRSRDDLRALPLGEALWGEAPWSLRPELDRLLPVALSVPSGRQVNLDYSSGQPVLAVKLQELFGTRTNPAVLDGRLPSPKIWLVSGRAAMRRCARSCAGATPVIPGLKTRDRRRQRHSPKRDCNRACAVNERNGSFL